ncbi:MAG: hypothetical protein LBH43_18655 [Treponema sp.]|nr:hypothetical protein [Treponema sp.]
MVYMKPTFDGRVPAGYDDTVKYDGCLEDDEDAENKRLLIGFDRSANPLEIYYNILDHNTVRVFHAMKCRNIHKHLLENEE